MTVYFVSCTRKGSLVVKEDGKNFSISPLPLSPTIYLDVFRQRKCAFPFTIIFFNTGTCKQPNLFYIGSKTYHTEQPHYLRAKASTLYTQYISLSRCLDVCNSSKLKRLDRFGLNLVRTQIPVKYSKINNYIRRLKNHNYPRIK